MNSTVKFSPLYGAHSEDPLCYLLQVDEFKILLDCGWTDSFNLALLEPLVEVAPTVDAVLLSHPDVTHLGALPYAYGKLGLVGTVYCTEPVRKLGTMFMYDLYQSWKDVSTFDVFTLDDVDGAFENTISLKYSQPQALGDKGAGITITPYAAGHLLGGTIWKISKDTEDIIYAVDYNHRLDKHLNSTVLGNFVRPTVLITDAANALTVEPRKKQRDTDFYDLLLQTLRSEGNVLLPVDTAGRVLELLLYLEQFLAQHKLPYPVAFLSHMAYNTLELAKSYLEWMSDNIAKAFETTRENSFQLKHVKLCHGKEELEALPPGPRVVLASSASLETGFIRDLFVEMAADPRNLVLFTDHGQAGSLARTLQSQPPPQTVTLQMSRKVPLEGEELAAFLAEKQRQEEEATARRQAEAARQAAAEAQGVGEGGGGAGKGSSEEGGAGTAEAASAEGPQPMDTEGGLGVVPMRPPQVLIEGFTPSPTAAAPMFPFEENKSSWDEYGEVINPDDFIVRPASQEEGMATAQEREAANGAAEAMEEELAGPPEEAPSKVVVNEATVEVRCSLRFLDFEGRSDGRSMKTILAHVSPLKLILIHGSPEATEHLRAHCKQHVCPFVYAPRVGEWLDVTSDLSAFKVRLTEELLQRVTFKQLGEYEVAWVDGQAGPAEAKVMPLAQQPPEEAPLHRSVFVGDLRLSDFKGLLKSNGVDAEFAGGGGLLRCGDSVAIRKQSGGQQVTIEGALSEDYYRIRDLLYSQFYVL